MTNGSTSTPLTVRDGSDGSLTLSSASSAVLAFVKTGSSIHVVLSRKIDSLSLASNQGILPLSMAQFLIHPKAPPRRIVSGCSVYTTIFDSNGSSSVEASVDDGCGNGGRGASNNERSAGAYLLAIATMCPRKLTIEILANTEARK